jgi:hypothetical protein
MLVSGCENASFRRASAAALRAGPGSGPSDKKEQLSR